MKILKIIGIIIIAIAVIFIFLILYASVTDYRPNEKTQVFTSSSPGTLSDSAELNLLIWNIGYSGLDKSMDFFYDGGKQVRTSKGNTSNNLVAVTDFLKQNDSVDFIMLQEVDKHSKRSYEINEVDTIIKSLSGYNACFGMNYDVFYVPLPFISPMGKVKSGILTLGKTVPFSSVRYSFPGNYAWPKSLFMLDRCFLVNRYPLTNGKELVLINTHNSAYDDGSLRKKQMEYLKSFLIKEYTKGNYIIVGGDWNQSPAGFRPGYANHPFDTVNVTYVSPDFMAPTWHWLYDKSQPSNRRVATPYDPEKTPTTVIDFYLLSPNIEPISVHTEDLGFAHSDHQPVIARIRLLGKK